ncbi:hypothetical protein TKK_0007330 [Trichogramma kaykai]
MGGNKGFSYAFGFCNVTLFIVGLWPKLKKSEKKDWLSIISFIFSLCIIIIFINIAQTTKLIIIWGDFVEMINNISTANLPIMVAVIKMFIFQYYKNVLGCLLSKAMIDWQSTKTQEQESSMYENARVVRKISMICCILGFSSVTGHLMIRICQELDFIPNYEKKREPMYLGAGLATLVYSGSHCLFVGLMLHLRGQVKNLSNPFGNNKTRINKHERQDSKLFKNFIKSVVIRHNDLYDSAMKIEKVFSKVFFVELITCTIQLCLQVFLLMLHVSERSKGLHFQIIFMMVYVLHIGTHIFICCYVADKLQDECLLFGNTIYNYEWYDLPPEDVRVLIIILRRSELPMQITAGKFVIFSLSLFAKILKTSGGYLSMLLAVTDI